MLKYAQKIAVKLQIFHKILNYAKKRFHLAVFCDRIYIKKYYVHYGCIISFKVCQ